MALLEVAVSFQVVVVESGQEEACLEVVASDPLEHPCQEEASLEVLAAVGRSFQLLFQVRLAQAELQPSLVKACFQVSACLY